MTPMVNLTSGCEDKYRNITLTYETPWPTLTPWLEDYLIINMFICIPFVAKPVGLLNMNKFVISKISRINCDVLCVVNDMQCGTCDV